MLGRKSAKGAVWTEPVVYDVRLDEPPVDRRAPRRGRRGMRELGTGMVVALAITAAFALIVSSSGGPPKKAASPAQHHVTGRIAHSDPAAVAAVRAALSTTTQSGSFNVTYEFHPLTAATTTTTTIPCAAAVPDSNPEAGTLATACSNPTTGGVEITGHGTIDTAPYAIVADSQVPGFGQITLYANDTDIWELGGGDYGLSSGSQSSGSGSSLSGFAGLVSGTLGDKEGALAMMSLANPTGYLDLEQQQITAADLVGTGSVDGAAVKEYKVFITPQQQGDLPGLTSEQSTTISNALATLATYGFEGSSVIVSVDASGYVRQTQSSAEFSDGSAANSESTLSDFGCAGTVVMPNQTGSDTPPAGCVSPDTGAPTATTTTTTP
jgi:hypothetical protein